MPTRIVIQSRLSSTRMPAKAMLTLAGRAAVVLCAQRASSTGIDVVVATSEETDDDAIATTVTAAGYRVFRGSLHDPLARFVGATADLDDDDLVVRLTADNVVPDGVLVEDVIDRMRAAGESYVRVSTDGPYGLGVEVFAAGLLRRAWRESVATYDREHVTPWIRRHTGDLTVAPEVDEVTARVRCTIDTLQDYIIAADAVGRVADPVRTTWRDLLAAWVAAGGARAAALPGTRDNALGQGPWLLGTVQIGIPYGAANIGGQPDLAMAARMLNQAAALGVTHVDTARAYGDSELRIGRSLAHGLSERLGVVTKVRPLDEVPVDAPPGWVDAAVVASVQESLHALRSNAVSALLLHRWGDWVKSGGAAARTLVRLRDEGLASVVGVSIGARDELVAALADDRVGYVQMPVNLVDRRWLHPDVQAALRARPDVVVTARSVFLQGLLVGGSNARWPDATTQDHLQIPSAVAQLVTELGRRDATDLCLAYVRGRSFVTSVVLGADTPEQIDDHAELMQRPPLTAQEIARVHDLVPAGALDLVDPSRWVRLEGSR